MNIKFEWEDIFSVGNEQIDKQHQHLFRLGNEILDADKNEGKRYVMELFKYTKAHFAEEEEHMKEIGFTDYEEHVEMHNKLITDLSAVSERYSCTQENINNVATFLYNWLTKHIVNEDMKYACHWQQFISVDFVHISKGAGSVDKS